VPAGIPTSLGSGIFALLSARVFDSIEEAQKKLCLTYQTYLPQPSAVAVYDQLFALYKTAYFALGERDSEPTSLGAILPELRRIAAAVRK
jgi:L-ribulokinase